jgi:hypothetical protein
MLEPYATEVLAVTSGPNLEFNWQSLAVVGKNEGTRTYHPGLAQCNSVGSDFA